MSTLEEEIRDLEAEIAEYRDMMKVAITLEEKKMYADLIIASTKTLNILLQQQSQAQAQGE
jgi:uridine kinase